VSARGRERTPRWAHADVGASSVWHFQCYLLKMPDTDAEH
jgi:hypothetical protein